MRRQIAARGQDFRSNRCSFRQPSELEVGEAVGHESQSTRDFTRPLMPNRVSYKTVCFAYNSYLGFGLRRSENLVIDIDFDSVQALREI